MLNLAQYGFKPKIDSTSVYIPGAPYTKICIFLDFLDLTFDNTTYN